jgi:hypothetical protein
MSNLVFNEITEYLFGPFSTFIYLNQDKIRFIGLHSLREKIITELNTIEISCLNPKHKIIWCIEESEKFKLSKGVFTPP